MRLIFPCPLYHVCMCVVYGVVYSLLGKTKQNTHTTRLTAWNGNRMYLFLDLVVSLQPMLKGMDGRVGCVSKNAMHTIRLAKMTQYYLAVFDTNAIMKIA